MTPDQSKQLKVGNRVCFNGEQTDCGTVTAVDLRYVIIKWEDGHQSHSSHNDMSRVSILAAKK